MVGRAEVRVLAVVHARSVRSFRAAACRGRSSGRSRVRGATGRLVQASRVALPEGRGSRPESVAGRRLHLRGPDLHGPDLHRPDLHRPRRCGLYCRGPRRCGHHCRGCRRYGRRCCGRRHRGPHCGGSRRHGSCRRRPRRRRPRCRGLAVVGFAVVDLAVVDLAVAGLVVVSLAVVDSLPWTSSPSASLALTSLRWISPLLGCRGGPYRGLPRRRGFCRRRSRRRWPASRVMSASVSPLWACCRRSRHREPRRRLAAAGLALLRPPPSALRPAHRPTNQLHIYPPGVFWRL